MKNQKRILIVDDDEDILTAGELLLKRHFGEVVTCHRPEQIPQVMNDRAFSDGIAKTNMAATLQKKWYCLCAQFVG